MTAQGEPLEYDSGPYTQASVGHQFLQVVGGDNEKCYLFFVSWLEHRLCNKWNLSLIPDSQHLLVM